MGAPVGTDRAGFLCAEVGRAPVKSVALVSRDNGVGLTVDMDLLESMLTSAGYRVGRVDWRARNMARVDVAMFLELWNPSLLRYAAKSVGIFNLEWFQSSWVRDLPRVTQLWAKSIEAHNVFTQRLRLRTSTHTGFMSRDFNDPTIPRRRTALHLRGHSDFKNTEAVLSAWSRHPDLPPLTVISGVHLDAPPHVRVLGRLSEGELRAELNAATFHICPSRAEGWGHYITEALSVGGVVVTTNASPMNEHVEYGWGALVPPKRVSPRGLAHMYGIDPEALATAVRRVAALPDTQLDAMRSRARAHFEARNARFQEIALRLLEEI